MLAHQCTYKEASLGQICCLWEVLALPPASRHFQLPGCPHAQCCVIPKYPFVGRADVVGLYMSTSSQALAVTLRGEGLLSIYFNEWRFETIKHSRGFVAAPSILRLNSKLQGRP